jgi:hypothetical protein
MLKSLPQKFCWFSAQVHTEFLCHFQVYNTYRQVADQPKKYFTLARRAALKRSRGDKHRKSCLRQHRLNIQQDRIEKKHRKEERKNLYCQKLETQAKKRRYLGDN